MRAVQPEPRRRWSRWSLRSVLLLIVPLCLAFACYGHISRQRQSAVDAFERMARKGVDANFSNGLSRAEYVFKNGNVTDADLCAFVPAFNGYAPGGFGRIVRIRLKGSQVSPEAVQRFRHSVPDCEVEP